MFRTTSSPMSSPTISKMFGRPLCVFSALPSRKNETRSTSRKSDIRKRVSMEARIPVLRQLSCQRRKTKIRRLFLPAQVFRSSSNHGKNSYVQCTCTCVLCSSDAHFSIQGLLYAGLHLSVATKVFCGRAFKSRPGLGCFLPL